MPSRSEDAGPALLGSGRLVLTLASVVAALLLPLPARAAQRTAADIVLVEAGAVIPEDLYAAGNRVVVEGRVDGDLVASAFADVLVSGRVEGDVIAMGGSVEVTGTVDGSVRAVAPDVRVGGRVEGDVVVLAREAVVTGSVGGDLLAWAWEVAVAGEVAGDVEGQSRTLTLAGGVDGDVDVTVDRLKVEEGASVTGDLGYRSPEPSSEVTRADVGGTVVHRSQLAANVRVRALLVLAKLLLGLSVAVFGLVVMWAAPDRATRAAASVRRSPVRAWGRGLAVLASPLLVVLVAVLLLVLTPARAAIPVVAVMAPVFLAVLGLVAAAAALAPVAVYPVIGDPRKGARTPVRAFLLGAAVVGVAALVPWVAWLVGLVVVPVGIGGWLGRARSHVGPTGGTAAEG